MPLTRAASQKSPKSFFFKNQSAAIASVGHTQSQRTQQATTGAHFSVKEVETKPHFLLIPLNQQTIQDGLQQEVR